MKINYQPKLNQFVSKMSSSSNKQIVCKEMCFYCFDVLANHLSRNANHVKSPTFTNDPYPLFVTWQAGKAKKLRGCIGTFSPLKLHKGLEDYALQSAMRDNRFEPISESELSSLYVSVSLLTNFEDGANYLDWEIGIHGIIIEIRDQRGIERSATFLPEVAQEHGWSKIETIDQLLAKAGFREIINQQTRESIRLRRYQSEKLQASYLEYQEWLSKGTQ